MKLNHIELSSIGGSLTTIGAALTLERVGIILGIVTGLLTFFLNVVYMLQKNAREQRQADLAIRESEARLRALGVKP